MNEFDDLFLVRAHCLRTIAALHDALAGMLTSGDNHFDHAEARTHLTKASNATKALLSHLELRYEFGNCLATPKENQCTD